MQHIIFEQKPFYEVAVLIKTNALDKFSIQQSYLDILSTKSVIAFDLEYTLGDKAPVKTVIEPYLNELLPVLDNLDTKVLLVADTNYFKKLTKEKKAEPFYGYILDCKYPGFEHMKVCLVPNYKAAFYDPKVTDRIHQCISALNDHLGGSYKKIGEGIVHSAKYVPCDVMKVREALSELYKYPSITLDTETFNLKHNRAGLGTIGFAWDKHNGICIDVDHGRKTKGLTLTSKRPDDWIVAGVMLEIKCFLQHYKGNIKYHNATYDIKILIRWLWMTHLLDTEGLLEGLEVMTRDFDCTQAVTYLATNSTAGNKLSLKEQAQEFLGNYAEDVKSILKVPTRQLMIYNLRDCLGTWFIWDKNYPKMVQDEQLDFYNNMAKPILKNIVQMELTGMPLNIQRVMEVNNKISRIVQRYERWLTNCNTIKMFTLRKKEDLAEEYNKCHVKQKTADEMKYVFNSGSGDQIAELLHGYLDFEVFGKTKTGKPATGGDELKGHMKRTDNKEYKNILKCLLKVEEGKKILSTFLSKFLDAERDDDGWYWLFGSFKFGGTVSYRISSSDPNLTNLPSGSTWGKYIKSCFQAPPKFLFCGLDYNALEDRINTILTQDPNKRKVYTDGYDGHALRAYSYFGDQMPGVVMAEQNERCFEIEQEDGSKSWIKVGTMVVTPEGHKMRIEDYYDTLRIT